MSGSYVNVDILYEGKELAKKYQANNNTWVEAKEDVSYHIKVTNISRDNITVKILVEGQVVGSRVIYPGSSTTVEDVVASVIQAGTSTREVRKELVFARPKLMEGEGEVTLDRQVAGPDGGKKLGCVSVQVYDAVRTEPRPLSSTVVSSNEFETAVGEKALKKKGAFKSTTSLGTKERVVEVHERQKTSEWVFGSTLLETVDLYYGSVAMLLILGVPAHNFMKRNANTPADTAPVDLTSADDQPALKKPKAERKPDVGAGGASSASASASASAPGAAAAAQGSPGLKRVKPEGGKKRVLDLTL